MFGISRSGQLPAATTGVNFFEMGVPDLCTGRAETPISSASKPSTRSVLLWTGGTAGGSLEGSTVNQILVGPPLTIADAEIAELGGLLRRSVREALA